MAISHLYPTQRPALDLNFARQKRLDSRVTFTRASTGTYVGSDGLIKTAAANEARFDHNPVTGESLGLLVEESRTNFLKYSQDISSQFFNNGYDGGLISPNSVVAPDGTLTGSKLAIVNGGTQTWWGTYNTSNYVTVVSGATYTYSCFFKAGEISVVDLMGDVRDGGGINLRVTFTLTNSGSYSLSAGSSAGITPLSNGWYRCWVTGTADASTSEEPGIYASYSGNGSDGFYAWGLQFEAGAFPTSYIPTTTATVTRSADVANLTGTNFSSWYNQSEGTFVASVDRDFAISGGAVFCLRSTSLGQQLQLTQFPLGGQNLMRFNTAWVNNLDVITNPVGVPNKVGVALAPSDFACCCNGGPITSNSAAGFGVYQSNTLDIGRRGNYNDEWYNGTFSRIAYYPVRLPDATLQALTL